MGARNATPSLLTQLAVLVGGVQFASIPREHVEAAKLLVLDTIGCALGARGCDPVERLRPALAAAGEKQEGATVWGTNQRVRLDSAILANGALVRYLDFMDVYWAREICHPSENIPVALACAEAQGSSGAALIEAVIGAYEVQVRLADAFSFESLGLHHVSAAGIVAPLVMGRLWGMPAAQAAQAAALGCFRHLTHAALVRGELSMAKAIGYASAASECVMWTRLAAQGFTGPMQLLEQLGVNGRLDLSHSTGAVRRVSIKQFPVQFTLQSPIEAALELRQHVGAAAIKSLRIEVHADAQRRTADPAKFNPANRETADHSLPCCVAMALLDGSLDKQQFDCGRWQQADVAALMGRIEVMPSQELEQRWPGGRPVRMTAVLQDGSERSVLVPVPLGDSTRPMDQGAITRKFMRLAEPVLGATQAQQVVQQVGQLERLRDVRALCGLLATARG